MPALRSLASRLPPLVIAATAALAAPARSTAQTSIVLGAKHALFTLGALDMKYVPDMHLGIVREPDGSCRVFISGIIGGSDSANGSTGLLSTLDFLGYVPLVGDSANAEPVFSPSCRDTYPAPCSENFDAGYAGANTMFRSANGRDLMMIYHGETRTFGTHTNVHAPFYAEVGLARSSDEGLHWAREGAILSGYDPKPATNPSKDANGLPAPGAILAGDSIYAFCAYFPSADSSDAGPSTIQVARAPRATDGAPGTWTKFWNGSFGVQPGLGGLATPVVSSSSACSSPRQPWVCWSTYLHQYVMLYVCSEGWFFSTSNDLVTWTSPAAFYTPPAGDTLFTPGEANDDNLVLVTPDEPVQVIGQTGYVLYAHTPSFGFGTGGSVPHELWMRPFTFQTANAGAPDPAGPTRLEVRPNPARGVTRIAFTLAAPGRVEACVFDLAGRRVRTLPSGPLGAGAHALEWDGTAEAGGRLPGGIYFVRVRAGGRSLSSPVIRLE